MVFKSACEDLQFQRIPEWDLFKRLNEWRNRMSVTRRAFLRNTTYAGAGLVVSDAVKPALALAGETVPSLKPYVTGMRMAATPASAYRAYRSKIVSNPDTTTWVQLDLGSSIPIDFIQLYPASERMYPGRDQYYAGEGFPLAVQDRNCRRTGPDQFQDHRRFHPIRFPRSHRQHHAVCCARTTRPIRTRDGYPSAPRESVAAGGGSRSGAG